MAAAAFANDAAALPSLSGVSNMTNKQTWHRLAEEVQPQTDALIDGEFAPAMRGERFDSINPATGRSLASIASCMAEDVDRAAKAARTAFEDGRWRNRAPRERKRILLRLADLIESHRDELALLETLEVGKPISDALSVDLPSTVNTFRWYAEAIDKVYGEVAPTPANSLAFITREPIGVVGVVVPWNFPLYMASWKVAPALATGNSVILKPAEQSSLSALLLGRLALEAGLPPGVLNVVPGYGEHAGQAMGRHPDIDAIAFTGSTEIGKRFLVYAGESNMKRVSLETGGKSPHIICADAPDLERAAHAAAWGVFFNQGQVCSAGSRLLVQREIQAEFVERVVRIAEDMRIGDPLDPQTQLGAVVDGTQLGRVTGFVERAGAEGARLRTGGRPVLVESGGFFFEPTVFCDVTNDIELARSEVFGPVLAVLAFDGIDEALRIANDTPFGLGAGIWTRNIDTALRASKELRAGQVWINNYDAGDVTVPWGGFKQSGNGRDKSLHALEKYTEVKATWIEMA